MKRNVILVLATLACVLFVAKGAVPGIDPYVDAVDEVPLAARDFYVRFEAFKDGREDKLCGGVRLNEKWILTAAECLDNMEYAFVKITALNNKVQLNSEISTLRKLDYLVHAQFDNSTKLHNLALVKSNFKNWNSSFNHAKLISKTASNSSLLNENAVVTGYNLPPDADGSRVLYVPSLTVKVVEPSLCEGLYSPSASKADQFCTLPVFGKGLTQDDIGAPLTLSNFRKHTLIGIVLKVSPRNGEQVQPIVFQKIAPYLKWLSYNTKIRLED